MAKEFNSMSEEKQEENLDMIEKCELLEFKMYSVRDILWFKQGHLKMKLPEEVEIPDGYNGTNVVKKLANLFCSKK